MTNEYLLSLFVDEPGRWGLRGDPYLWREKAIPLLLQRQAEIQ